MSEDLIVYTEDLSKPHCPGCEPERDPSREILSTRWCPAHDPALGGPDDALFPTALPSGSADSEGETNRLFAALIRRAEEERR